MKRIVITIVSFLFLSPAFADKDSMVIFKKTTQETIAFINNEQNKETFLKVDYKIPVKRAGKSKAGAAAAAKKEFVRQKYDFSTKTPYGDFKVLVFEDEKSFKISFSS